MDQGSPRRGWIASIEHDRIGFRAIADEIEATDVFTEYGISFAGALAPPLGTGDRVHHGIQVHHGAHTAQAIRYPGGDLPVPTGALAPSCLLASPRLLCRCAHVVCVSFATRAAVAFVLYLWPRAGQEVGQRGSLTIIPSTNVKVELRHCDARQGLYCFANGMSHMLAIASCDEQLLSKGPRQTRTCMLHWKHSVDGSSERPGSQVSDVFTDRRKGTSYVGIAHGFPVDGHGL